MRVFTAAQRGARRAYSRQYDARPEVKLAKAKREAARNATPEGKRRKQLNGITHYQRNRERILLLQKKRFAEQPGVKAAQKERQKRVRATPEGKAANSRYTAKYYLKPGIKERMKQRRLVWFHTSGARERHLAKLRTPEARATARVRSARKAKEHPEYFAAANGKYREKKSQATPGMIAVIAKWFKKWNSLARVKCFWCRGTFDPKECHGDHILALSRGGAHAIENMCISCCDCNLQKNAKLMEIWNQQITEPILL